MTILFRGKLVFGCHMCLLFAPALLQTFTPSFKNNLLATRDDVRLRDQIITGGANSHLCCCCCYCCRFRPSVIQVFGVLAVLGGVAVASWPSTSSAAAAASHVEPLYLFVTISKLKGPHIRKNIMHTLDLTQPRSHLEQPLTISIFMNLNLMVNACGAVGS